MKTKLPSLLLYIVIGAMPILGFSQCPPDGTFTSQAEIDALAIDYPDCTEIPNGLIISGEDIIDLTPLNTIATVSREISIRDNPLLETLNGLDGILSFYPIGVGVYPADINIENNNLLIDISALGNMSVTGSIGIEALQIKDNPSLNSLNGLQGVVDWVTYYVFIDNNDSLVNLHGLNNITGCEELEIKDNNNLNSVTGLESMLNIGSIRIMNNDNLVALTELSAILDCGLQILDNELLQNIDAFEFSNVCTIPFEISNNPSLSLCSTDYICSFIDFHGNNYVTIENNAQGCNSNAQVTYNCGTIPSNDDCNGALDLVIGETLEAFNELATTSVETPACNDEDRADVWFTFNSGSYTSVDIITDAGYNLQLWSGTCGALTQVVGACDSGSLVDIPVTTSTDYYVQVWSCASCRLATGLFDILVQDGLLSTQDNLFEGFSMYPNPVNSILNFKANQNITSIDIYNLLGQSVIQSEPNETFVNVNMSNFQTAMYVVEIKIGEQTATYKFVKE